MIQFYPKGYFESTQLQNKGININLGMSLSQPVGYHDDFLFNHRTP
jgi:hypothetical protein